MNDELKENIGRSSTWIRGAYMLLFFVIFNVMQVVVTAVILIQFGFMIITGNNNENLRDLGKKLGIYFCQMIKYLTYESEDKPYPFGSWPRDTDEL
jgi:hypothetical protein